MLCMHMMSIPQLLYIGYAICVVWVRGQYRDCVLRSLFFYWMLHVHRGYKPHLRISITSFIGYVFVNDSFIYTYVITCIRI